MHLTRYQALRRIHFKINIWTVAYHLTGSAYQELVDLPGNLPELLIKS